MARDGFIVPPLSTAAIYKVAKDVRAPFEAFMAGKPYVPIDLVLEVLPELLDGFELHVCGQHEMGVLHGETEPANRIIRLREDVYNGMCQGVGRDRFTAAHELGHLFLHSAGTFARRSSQGAAIYRCSEWQADTFASAFLIDEAALARCRTIQEVMSTFGVSESAASCRWRRR